MTADGKIYKYLSSERREDAELAKAAYKASTENYEYIPPLWRDGLLSDEEKISRARGVGYKYLPVNDRMKYAKVAVAAWSGNYMYVPMDVRSSNEELAMLAVADKPRIYYQFVPEEIRAESLPLAKLAIEGSQANRACVPENILNVLDGK